MKTPSMPRHFDGQKYFNYWSQDPKTAAHVFAWMRSRVPSPWPQTLENPPADAVMPRVSAIDMRITMIGHASLLIQMAGLNILTDPVWSQRTSPVQFAGPKRVRAPGLALSDLPKIDIVIVSHNHFDHMDLPTLKKIVAMHNPKIITPIGNAKYMRGNIIELDWDEAITIDTVQVECEPVQHWSRRRMNDENKALWAGFTIKSAAGNLYFAGDTGFHPYIFDRAREKHQIFRCALLPIGAYAPRWFMGYQHMNPREAVHALKLLNATTAIGIHHGVWQLTDEPINQPIEQLKQALSQATVNESQFVILPPGQAIDLS
jgi:L-ascorbate metabolism protein UlaG (beta-lactamase superfamily)